MTKVFCYGLRVNIGVDELAGLMRFPKGLNIWKHSDGVLSLG
jgi:hypothetical protein